MLTLLKQRKMSCILKVKSPIVVSFYCRLKFTNRILNLLISLQLAKILIFILQAEAERDGVTSAESVEKELEEIERKMSDLEKDREDRSKRIMDRRVLQVTTLQELGRFIDGSLQETHV